MALFSKALLLTLATISMVKAMLYQIDNRALPYYEPYTFESIITSPKSVSYVQFELSFSSYSKVPNVFLVISEHLSIPDGSSICQLANGEYNTDNKKGYKIYGVTEKELSGQYFIPFTGIYSFAFLRCDTEDWILGLNPIVDIKGKISIVSDNSYLPAHRKPFVTFNIITTTIYLLITIVWSFICFKNKKNLFFYHHCITIMASLSFLYSLTCATNFLYANLNGNYIEKFSILSTFFNVSKKIFGRIILLSVCLGMGITRTEIPKRGSIFLAILSFVYLIISLVESYEKKRHYFEYYNTLLYISNALLFIFDVMFYTAIFVSLYRTLKKISENDKFKKSVFKSVVVYSMFAFVNAIIFEMLQIRFIAKELFLIPTQWNIFWVYDVGFWEFLNLYFIIISMKILSPYIEIAKYIQVRNDDKKDLEDVSVNFSLTDTENGEKIQSPKNSKYTKNVKITQNGVENEQNEFVKEENDGEKEWKNDGEKESENEGENEADENSKNPLDKL